MENMDVWPNRVGGEGDYRSRMIDFCPVARDRNDVPSPGFAECRRKGVRGRRFGSEPLQVPTESNAARNDAAATAGPVCGADGIVPCGSATMSLVRIECDEASTRRTVFVAASPQST
jgi:hypothetical protein